jgi:two-component system, sensor histidine kinase and response regulator
MTRAKILNVDDQEISRYIRTQTLQGAGYEVIEAATGADALRLLDAEHPQVVLLDINLPDIHGTEICRRIRADPDTHSVIVVHVSSTHTSPQDRAMGLEGGADGYLAEPVEPELLLATVRSFLRLWTAESRLEQSLAEIRETEAALRQTNAALQRSNEDLAQFAYAASHDLQEPLRTVAVYNDLLVRQYGAHLDQDARTYISFTQDAVRRMQILIQDLLVYSQLQTEDFSANLTIDAKVLVELALANLKNAIDENGATISYSELPAIRADVAQLAQVFQNLIGNAIKYRKPDEAPRVEISAALQTEGWVFCVRDNGIGFEQKDADKIFGIFKRLHNRDIPGTGIGLAIVKKIVERHRGQVWAESVPGEGAAFYFRLPLATNAAGNATS